MPDGKKFIMNATSQQTGQAMAIISNWSAVLKP